MNDSQAPPPEWSRRLDALERRNRRLSGLVTLLVIMAFVQTAWHLMPAPEMVSARRFVLKERGRPNRGEFSIWQDGTPAFRINNANGEARALWALRKDGTLSLRMSDARFQTRAELFVTPEGLPHLSLYGDDGRSRAVLWVNRENLPELKYPAR